jgi:serine/threonine protein kinase/Flp pilus assembly protein TadD
MPVDPNQVKSIFLAAAEKAAPAERAAFLEAACAGDPGLRRRVEELLRANDQSDSFLESPAVAAGGTGDYRPGDPPAGELQPPAEGPGTRLGPYKLLEQIGEGGMGTVWMAEQQEPVRRRVALKVTKAGLDSAPVIARFEAERQALALMDHPHIAQVFDGGTTAGGRPYFVMELVKGTPITRYCDEHRLTPRQRLELFAPVCQAIQHAHQKGIIHRDVKPSNVLVAPYDGKPVVKVIDFGVAKATGQRLTERTLFTGFGAVVGTLEYMSPEQAELNNRDIDTRSDIYSLGVLLYELLTGTTPLERNRAQEAGLLEALRIIREEETPRPSMRLSTLEELPSIAANRGLEPKKLSGLVRGELDWIVMKALEKDRTRRYETADGLARDLQRYLADEPVEACPPSAGYRLKKFARRHKVGLAIAGLTLFFLVLLGGGLGWLHWDKAARREKTNREVNQALQEAVLLRGKAQALKNDLALWGSALSAAKRAEGLLDSGEGDEDLRQRVRALLAELETEEQERRMLARLTQIHLDQDVSAAAREYAKAFHDYGIDVEELEVREAADRLQKRSISVELAAVLDHWAELQRRADKPEQWKHLLAVARAADRDPWRDQVREALSRRDRQALIQLAASDRIATLQPPTLDVLANALAHLNALEHAVTFLRRAQRQNPADFWVSYLLAIQLARVRPPQWDEAVGFYRAAVALRPQSARLRTNFGTALGEKGAIEEAIVVLHEAIRLNDKDPDAHNSLGTTLLAKGDLDGAIAEYHAALRLKKDNAIAHNNLGSALKAKGDVDGAIVEYREALRLNKDFAMAHYNLANALKAKGDLGGAIVEFREAVRLKKDYAEAHNNLGVALMDKGDMDGAIVECREALRLKKDLPQAHYTLANALKAKGEVDGAIAEYREALRLNQDYAEAHCNLGLVLMRQKGQFREAVAELRRGHQLGARQPRWPYPSGQWLREAEQLAHLDDRLRAVLEGKAKPSDAAERLRFAQLCQGFGRRYAAAARFFAEAFAEQPALAANLATAHRYNAACAAVLAGCGQGPDATTLDDAERARLRRQALGWLRADLTAWRAVLEKDPDKARAVQRTLRHWQQDVDLAEVRGDALVKLAAAEWRAWQQLWADVDQTLRKANHRDTKKKPSN